VNATAASNAVNLASTVNGQTVIISQGAVLDTGNVALDPNSTQATTTMGMGVSNLTLGTFRLTATSTPISVTELDFTDSASATTTATTTAAGTFTGLSLVVAGQTTALQTQPGFSSAGIVKFTLPTPLTVPQNGYVSVNLVGSIPSYNSYSASEGTTHYIWLTGAVSQTAAGASSTVLTSAGAHTPAIMVFKTTPTAFVGSNSLPSGFSAATAVSGGGYVGAFSLTAGAGGDVYVQSFNFQQSAGGTLLGATSSVDYAFYDSTNTSNALATVTGLTGNNAATTVSFSGGWDVPANTTRTLVVKITNHPTTTSQTNPVAFTVSVQGGLTWSDGVTTTTALPSNIVFPQNSSVVSATN
jgi:hypothetical protein